jgi:hypothetical protein
MARTSPAWAACILALVMATPSAAYAQKKGEPKKDDAGEGDGNKDDAEWNSLAPTAENKPEETGPVDKQDDSQAASPYRSTVDDQQLIEEVEDEDDGEGMSEAMAAMKNWTPRYAQTRAGLDWDVVLQGNLNMTWDAKFRVAFGEESTFALDFAIPWAWADGGGAIFGNPVIGLLGGGKLADFMGLWGGGWVGIPTDTSLDVADPEDLNGFFQRFTSALFRAGIESHRFVPVLVSARFAIGAEFQLHPLVYLRVEFDPQATIPTQGSGGNFTMDQINEIEALAPFGLGGGFRFQGHYTLHGRPLYVFIPGAGTDKAQLALEPFISYEPPNEGDYAVPMYARVGLLMPLDSPFGFDVTTLRTSVGGRF